jgi:hypothetical protein
VQTLSGELIDGSSSETREKLLAADETRVHLDRIGKGFGERWGRGRHVYHDSTVSMDGAVASSWPINLAVKRFGCFPPNRSVRIA